MASLKKVARRVPRTEAAGKDTDVVIELSVTVGYLGADVRKEELAYLERLLLDHCDAGLVSIERGDLEQHLHFQMVYRARVNTARGFGVLVRKYMKWYGVKNMAPAGKVTCKVLTNRLIHTWKGMFGYCLKDSGTTHFEVAMHNISDEEVIAGKTLHSIYGKADLKQRVSLTPKNVGERAYVWWKYTESRQLTATFLSTLTDMVNSAMFIPASQWIVPCNGQGMDQPKMNAYWKCLTDPPNVVKSECAEIFVNTREQFKARYYAEQDIPMEVPVKVEKEEYSYGGSPPSPNVFPGFIPRKIPRTLNVPSASPGNSRSAYEVTGKNIFPGADGKLFYEPSEHAPFGKAPTWTGSEVPDFIPLKEKCSMPTNVYLPTVQALSRDRSKKQASDVDFWKWLDSCKEGNCAKEPNSNLVPVVKSATEPEGSRGADVRGAEQVNHGLYQEENDGLYHEGMELIILSSDSEGEEDIVKAAEVVEDRTGLTEHPFLNVPKYFRVEDSIEASIEAVATSRPTPYKTDSRN